MGYTEVTLSEESEGRVVEVFMIRAGGYRAIIRQLVKSGLVRRVLTRGGPDALPEDATPEQVEEAAAQAATADGAFAAEVLEALIELDDTIILAACPGLTQGVLDGVTIEEKGDLLEAVMAFQSIRDITTAIKNYLSRLGVSAMTAQAAIAQKPADDSPSTT